MEHSSCFTHFPLAASLKKSSVQKQPLTQTLGQMVGVGCSQVKGHIEPHSLYISLLWQACSKKCLCYKIKGKSHKTLYVIK